MEQMMRDKPVIIADLQRVLADGDRLVVTDRPLEELRPRRLLRAEHVHAHGTGRRGMPHEAHELSVPHFEDKNESILFESTDKKDLNELWESLTLETPVERFHCMCIGNPILYVYRAEHVLISLSNHHGSSVRCSLWTSDVPVLDTEKWLSWFDRRGIAGPRREVEEGRAEQAQATRDYERWLSAMPSAVREVWSLPLNPFQLFIDVIPLRDALETKMPEERDRILSLLEWFGSGAGSWSGYPVYEVAAEELLLDYSTPKLVAALESKVLTPAQKEGAARLFAGGHAAKHRPPDLHCLPDSLKQLLWNHTKNTQDGDKLSRVARAFEMGINREQKR